MTINNNETLEHMEDSNIISDLMAKWNIKAIKSKKKKLIFKYNNDIKKMKVENSSLIEHRV